MAILIPDLKKRLNFLLLYGTLIAAAGIGAVAAWAATAYAQADGTGTARNAMSDLPGDMNGDQTISLEDATIALRIIAGEGTETQANPSGDVDGDSRIGLVEAIYGLRSIAGLQAPLPALIRSAAAYETAPSCAAGDLENLIAGFSEFTIEFYHALKDDAEFQDENFFFSAYSIENALAMTWAGAQNQTATQMAQTLHLNLPQERFHPTLNALNIDINSRDDQPPPTGDAFALSLVNAVWSRIGYPFIAPYLEIIATNYDAGVRVLDFVGYPEESRQTINHWVAGQTQDRIRNLLPQGAITSYTAVVLTNAIYFKGSWFSKFDADMTAPGPFTRLDGTQVTANLMHQRLDVRAFQGDGFDMVELPYVSARFAQEAYPEELAMLVIVPQAGRFEAVQSALNKTGLDGLIASLSMQTVDLTFPRFEFEAQIQCKEILESLGMADAFNPVAADFSAMVDPQVSTPWIDQIYHKAFVAVDETGTEAAAATAVVMTDTSVPDPVSICADRPFIFVIRDNITQAILFMGRLLDPSA